MPGSKLQCDAQPAFHHFEWVVFDLAATHHYYTEFLGLPLVNAWVESIEFDGERLSYINVCYGLGGGQFISFFAFSTLEDYKRYAPPENLTPFTHIALSVSEEGFNDLKSALLPSEGSFIVDHGYCKSLYTKDPNGLLLEFNLSEPAAKKVVEANRVSCLTTLGRWLDGDQTVNNTLRPKP